MDTILQSAADAGGTAHFTDGEYDERALEQAMDDGLVRVMSGAWSAGTTVTLTRKGRFQMGLEPLPTLREQFASVLRRWLPVTN